MEYVAGPVLALLIAMKFTTWKTKQCAAERAALKEEIALLKESEVELPKRIMATVMPIAKAVNKLNQQVGL
jgi:hypothetical protein